MSIVRLNIGGVHYVTSTATLSRYPDTMLARLIRQPIEMDTIDNGGELFIDRDGTNFGVILNYLRHGDQTVLPTIDSTRMISLKQEANFYGLAGLAELINRCGLKVGDYVRFHEAHKFGIYVWEILRFESSQLRDLRCEVCHEVAVIGPQDELRNWEIFRSYPLNPLGRIVQIQGDCARVNYTFGSMRQAFSYVDRNVARPAPPRPIFSDFVVNIHIPLKYLKVDVD